MTLLFLHHESVQDPLDFLPRVFLQLFLCWSCCYWRWWLQGKSIHLQGLMFLGFIDFASFWEAQSWERVSQSIGCFQDHLKSTWSSENVIADHTLLSKKGAACSRVFKYTSWCWSHDWTVQLTWRDSLERGSCERYSQWCHSCVSLDSRVELLRVLLLQRNNNMKKIRGCQERQEDILPKKSPFMTFNWIWFPGEEAVMTGHESSLRVASLFNLVILRLCHTPSSTLE